MTGSVVRRMSLEARRCILADLVNLSEKRGVEYGLERRGGAWVVTAAGEPLAGISITRQGRRAVLQVGAEII